MKSNSTDFFGLKHRDLEFWNDSDKYSNILKRNSAKPKPEYNSIENSRKEPQNLFSSFNSSIKPFDAKRLINSFEEMSSELNETEIETPRKSIMEKKNEGKNFMKRNENSEISQTILNSSSLLKNDPLFIYKSHWDEIDYNKFDSPILEYSSHILHFSNCKVIMRDFVEKRNPMLMIDRTLFISQQTLIDSFSDALIGIESEIFCIKEDKMVFREGYGDNIVSKDYFYSI